MTQFLPPNLLALFAPRDPIFFLPPTTKLSHEKKTHGYFGVGQYLHLFEDPKDTPPPIKIETREERLERKQREKLERAAYIREQGIALWDPYNNVSSTGDAYKTLFVARINPDTTESKLKKEFEIYGAIRKICLINDKISGKPKGYAFIEFETEKDMHAAYKHADGKKIEGRRVLVDVERGRTVKGWLPRRLGGGINSSKTRSGEDREDSYRSERRDRDRSSRRSRSTERERSRRRSRDRERERSRDYRDKSHRDSHRDRHKDRYESKLRRDESKYESRGGYDRDGDQGKVISHYDGDSYVSSRRHRSRSRDRERKRHVRSRSRSQERNKRSRMIESNNGSMNMDKERQHYNYDIDTGEIEEGEDRSYDGYSKHNNNNEYDNYNNSYSQPAYVAYKVKSEN